MFDHPKQKRYFDIFSTAPVHWACIRYRDMLLVYRLWDGKVVWVSEYHAKLYYPVGWSK